MTAGSRRMFGSAASLLASTVVTSGLGVLYWIVAARVASVEQVAAATALVSAMTLLLNVGQFGFGTMLIAEGARGERRMGPLVAASVCVVGAAAGTLTIIFVVLARLIDSTLARSLEGWPAVLGLVAGVIVGAVGLVLDETLIGVRLSSVQLYRNIVFAASKLALLWGVALAVEVTTTGTIIWAWVAGSVLSLGMVVIDLHRRGRRVLHPPRLTNLSGLAVVTADHNTVNFAQMAPRLGLPLLVAVVLVETDYAAFFIAWMIASFLYMVPTHLSTAMFAIAVGDHRVLADRLRAGLLLLLGPGVVAALIIGLMPGVWLGIFGPDYRVAATGLGILVAGYLPCVFKQLYIAVERVAGRLRPAGIVLAGAAILELVGGTIGAILAGIEGAAAGYVLGSCVPILLYLSSLARALTPERNRRPLLSTLFAIFEAPTMVDREDLRSVNRSVTATGALAGGLAGLVVLIPAVPPLLAAILVGIFLTTGPGCLIVALLPRVPRPLAVAAIPTLGIATLSLVVTAELAAGQLHSRLTLGILSSIVVVGALILKRRDAWAAMSPRRLPLPTWRVPWMAATFAVLGVVQAMFSMARMSGSEPTSFGPLARVPELALAVVLVAAALVLALRARSFCGAWIAVISAVIVIRAPTLFPTETALYEWTYRHVGVIDWFVQSGHLARDVDVYNNWPGALAVAAWYVDVTDTGPLGLAHGYQLGFHFLLVLVVYALGRCAGLSTFGAVAGAGVVEFAGWVAQDYLAPQSFAYLLATVAIAALLVTSVDRYRVAGIVIGLVTAAAVAWSHPLTPVWLVVMVVVLGALRYIRPWWVVLAVLLVYAPSALVNLDSILTNSATFTFDILENTRGNVRTVGSVGQQTTSALVQVLSGSIWLAALVIAFRRGHAWAPLTVLGFGSFILIVSSYGGEAVFRVFLFSLLGCGLLIGGAIAAFLAPTERDSEPSNARTAIAILGLSTIALFGLQGFLGGWYALRFTVGDVVTAQRIERNAGATGSVVPLEYAFPLRSTARYLPQARDDSVEHERWDLHDHYVGTDGSDPGPAIAFTEAVQANSQVRPVYVVTSRSIRDFIDYFGLMDDGGAERVIDHLREGGWEVVHDEDGTLVVANPAGVAAWR